MQNYQLGRFRSVAVESSKENVKYNSKQYRNIRRNLVEVIDGKADVVVANILAEIYAY